MKNLGDFTASKTVRCFFNTRGTTGAPITLAGTPAISVYKDGGTTESTAGVTLTTDFDSRTGLHLVAVDTSADGTFYSAGSDFNIVITTGTVDSISVVGVAVGVFSIANRSALMPTTAGRTLDVSAGGEAGLDWANVGSPTTSLALTGTTISTSQVAASVTAGVTVTTNNDKTGYSLASGGLSAVTAWTVAITGNITGNLSGSVGSVTAGVTVTTNNDKTGYSLAAAGLASVTAWTVAITGNITGNLSGSVGSVTGLNASLLDVAVSTLSTYAGADTAGTTTLLSRLTSQRAGWLDNLQFLDMSIIDARDAILGDIPSAGAVATAVWANGTRTLSAFAFSVTVGTNNDKTGYSLASGPPTAADIWTYGTRTLTSGGGGSGGATVEEITAALETIIAGRSFTLADRETLGHALTLEQFMALK